MRRPEKNRSLLSDTQMALPLPQLPTTMDSLPDEVLSHIFIRLLAKQLAQMRCICRSWNLLLSESSFVKSHLHRSIHTNNEILLFFHRGFSFDCSSFTARPSRSPNLEPTNFIKLPVNPQPKYTYGRVIGSVNGLICISYGPYYDFSLHIWNPSLSAMLTLPPCSLPSCDTIKIHLRFGYDPKTDDYKVVKFTGIFEPLSILPQGEVYSMRKGLWELLSQEFPSHIIWVKDQDEVCVDGHDGHLHWLGYIHEEFKAQTIVAFDLGAETFHEIPLSDFAQGWGMNLGVLGGKLCVIACVEGGGCEVWVMDEYGVPESWVKHQVFSQFSRGIIPYGFTLQNEFLFLVSVHDDGFGLYDPITAKTKTFRIKDGQWITKIVEYVDSLVWIAPAKPQA